MKRALIILRLPRIRAGLSLTRITRSNETLFWFALLDVSCRFLIHQPCSREHHCAELLSRIRHPHGIEIAARLR